jgi:GT2 family glycosyltransferase
MGDNNQYGRREFKTTIIVRAHGNPELTENCLTSIKKNTADDSFRIILVDQAGAYKIHRIASLRSQWRNTPGCPEQEYVDWFMSVVTRENMGAVRATNLGLQLAMLDPGEFVLVLDNDTEIPSGDREWLNRWLHHMDNPAVGAAGATTDYVLGQQNIAQTPRTYTKEASTANEGGAAMTGPWRADYLISFACLYRKEALRRVVPPTWGPKEIELVKSGRLKPTAAESQGAYLWDERFEPGNSEDLDISVRLRLAQYDLVIARDVYVHHVGSQAFKDMGFQDMLARNVQKLREKWGDHLLAEIGLVRKAAS